MKARRRPGQDARSAAPPRRNLGPSAVLAMQQMAGNRAVGRLARQPKGKEKEPPPLTADQDLVFAVKYVTDYYTAVREVLGLKNEIEQQAIENYKQFGALKDPPSVTDAVLAEIFNQVVGLIPGGKLVSATLTAGVFAVQLAELQRDLELIPGASIEDEHRKGPSEKTKAKVEKVVGGGKQAIDSGKAIVGAGIKAAEEQAAASKAEAAAQENAAMQGRRITEWRKGLELARRQERAIVDELELAVRKGTDSGKLKQKVIQRLGPFPEVSEAKQDELERLYELQLYRQKLTLATTTHHYRGGGARFDSDETELELVDGGTTSAATRRRIAALLRMDWLAAWPLVLGHQLGVGASHREKWSKPPGMELEPSRPGMGG
jgi:hypothetical protein